MNKKTSVTVLGVVVVAAIFFGFVLLNKSDGPVTGMMLSGSKIESVEGYDNAAKAKTDGIYMIVTNSFNKYNEELSKSIPAGKDLYAAVYFVECPEGSEYTGKWIKESETVAEETGTLATGPKGVISYMLDKSNVVSGSYIFELYDGDTKIFEKTFSVK